MTTAEARLSPTSETRAHFERCRELAANHLLGEANRQLLDYAAEHPEYLQRAAFCRVHAPQPYVKYPLQSWPLLLDAEAVHQAARAAVAMARLIRTLPERIFGFDPAKIGEYCGLALQDARFLTGVLRDPDLCRRGLARPDFVLTADGFRCLEMNASTNLGGWQVGMLSQIYLEDPAISRFLAAKELSVAPRDAVIALMRFLYREARSLCRDGDFNVAIIGDSNRLVNSEWQGYFNRCLETVLREAGAGSGRVVMDIVDAFRENGEKLTWNGHTIHAVLEVHSAVTPRLILIPWLSGHLKLYNGPPEAFLRSKRNLALLSEYADTSAFDSEERELIHALVPWTRTIHMGNTVYRGKTWSFPDLVRAERERLVLKPDRGYSGKEVYVGRAVSEARWMEVCRSAAREGDWTIQEFAESVPFALRAGDDGIDLFTVIWGLFDLGGEYGGGFLRLAPHSYAGAISSGLGAAEGIFLEVQEPDAEPSRAPS